VIGASGFIGAKLFFSLARLRSDVFAVSRQVESSWRLLHCPYGNRIALDITVPQEVDDAIKRHRPRTVFNLSAYGAYERQNAVRRIHQVNYTGTLNLVQSLTETGCDAFVQAGTSSEYGYNCTAPRKPTNCSPTATTPFRRRPPPISSATMAGPNIFPARISGFTRSTAPGRSATA